MSRNPCAVSPLQSPPYYSLLTIPYDEGNENTRSLGLVVARGTIIVLISPADGSEEIANPFVQPEE